MIFSINQRVAIPCYTKDSFNKLQTCDEDEEVIFETWEDWHESMEGLEIHLLNHGIEIKEVYINIDELIQYCRLNNVKNSSKIRAQFALLKSN
ncbi:MAG: hypothetical protein GXO79_06080 [Chlorobi bacterium]|nr:hypothetical protein [Chlorobiota bacterium]